MKRMAAAAAALGMLLLVAGIWSRRPAPLPASLLLVTIDTLRADRVGAYGSGDGLTPAIDRLAAAGWRFENAMSPAPLTLPSHSTLLSGLDPPHHGVRNNGAYAFPAGRETLATLLKSRGYATGAFVASVVLDRRYGLARGFDVYDDRIVRVSGGRSVLESERSCDAVVANAAAWIRAAGGPFFAWVHFYEPHAPYAPPEDLARAHPGRPYEAEVAAADHCLARLVAAAGAARPGRLLTAVVGDHGEGLGDHGESTHGLFLYQSTLHVPMVIAGPGVEAGKRTRALARGADLAPTLLSLLGAPPLPGIDGRDLAGGGAGESYAETDYPAGFGWAPLRSWRLGDLKLIEAPVVELYDLAHDPGEERNLAGARPREVERLRGVLRAALKSETRPEARRPGGEAEEGLRSLGYVSGVPTAAAAGRAMDPKAALPLFNDFERAMESESRGDLKASARIFGSLVKKDPANVTFRRSLASALRRGARADEAARVLADAEKSAPGDAAVIHDLAMALADQGREVQAIELEDRAVALDPGFVDAFNHLATLHALRGEFAKGREAVDRAIALDPNNAEAWSNRGNLARGQGQAEEARRSYERALALAPDQVEATNGLGVLAVEAGRLEEAAGRFERVLELAPGFHEARLNLAVVELQRGRSDRALALALEVERGAETKDLKAKAASFLRDLRAAAR
jgi:tetratricopeptide (TPR) repeat protein